MSVDVNTIMLKVIPWLKSVLLLVFGLGGVIALGYYLLVIKQRRLWFVNIYEEKADGRLHLIGKDKCVERKFNKGKQLAYILKKYKTEVFPPPWECTYRVHNKEYCDYLRIRDIEYVPIKKNLLLDTKTPVVDDKGNTISWYKKMRMKLAGIKHMSADEVIEKYIHIPINYSLHAKIEYETMDYDVNMMRINAIDNRDKIYADMQSWIEKYGTYLALGMVVVLIIVVLYFSYDFVLNVFNAAMSKADQTLNMAQTFLDKMSGVPPAS